MVSLVYAFPRNFARWGATEAEAGVNCPAMMLSACDL